MAFLESSKSVADKFLQNIVFVDERAYVENDDNQQHSFNAKSVSEAFARKQKLCTVFAPSTQEEVEQCVPMMMKADVVVLDWNLDFENTGAEDMADAEDADIDDSRGQHSLNLISRIVESAGQDKIRIIVIYTGETDLAKITREIHDSLDGKGFSHDNCKVSSANVCILVRAKRNGDEVRYQYLPELQAMVCGYNELPDLILDEFTKMVYGLLPNYALNAITAIRESTSKILGVFSKELDAAYLGHQIAIPDREDAPRLLAELFGTSIKELLEDSHLICDGFVDEWIDEHVSAAGKQVTIKNQTQFNRDKAHKLFKSEKANLKDKLIEVFGETVKNEANARITVTALYEEKAEEINKRFAGLTQMRNTFGPTSHPKKLNQGTIVKSADNYYVCVQPRCDTGRIIAKQDDHQAERQFLFLPLMEGGNGPAVIVDNRILRVDIKSYHLSLFYFTPDEGAKVIMFKHEGEQLVVSDKQGTPFVWKGELKELQAQRISTVYSTTLSRVGLDESDWLRLQGGE